MNAAVLELWRQGGAVMWPLALMSVAAVAIALERAYTLSRLVRGERGGAPLDPAVGAVGAGRHVEAVRRAAERFLPLLSGVVTAAPMLGVLGTVLGIRQSFTQLGTADGGGPDLEVLGLGIAQALISTAAGLSVALVALFPFLALRAAAARAVRLAWVRARPAAAAESTS